MNNANSFINRRNCAKNIGYAAFNDLHFSTKKNSYVIF